MNILTYAVLLLLAVNLSQENLIPMGKDKINILKLPRDIGSNIKELLEEFRNRMCYEIPRLNIPKLDPFGIDNFEFSLEQEMADLDIKISDLSVAGIAKFDFPKLNFSPVLLKLDLHLVLPKIVLTTDYKINGTIKGLFDLKGDGDIKLEADNIELILVARFKYTAGVFSFHFEKLEPSIEKILCRINNLFPDDELNDFVSEMITNIAVELIDDLWTEHGGDIKEIIEMMVTGLLDGLTVKDLLEMLNNLGDIFEEDDPKPDCKFPDLLHVLRHGNFFTKINKILYL